MQILFGVNVEIFEGERVALLGTNGAGKSTLLNVVSGLLKPSVGTVIFDGQDITGEPPDARVRAGLIQMPGGRSTFPSLTVTENLRMGAYPFLRERELVDSRTAEVLDLFPQLAGKARQPAGTLSGGEQQMLGLGRAMIAGPKLLMIDELSLGLAPVVLQEIVKMTEEIVRRGTTLVIVEQSLNVAITLASRALFMEKGEVRFSGSPSELLDNDTLARSVFFGAAKATPRPAERKR